jgi:hypothetical protein
MGLCTVAEPPFSMLIYDMSLSNRLRGQELSIPYQLRRLESEIKQRQVNLGSKTF